MDHDAVRMLLVRADGLLIALPLEAIREVTPRLPTTPVAKVPARIRGFAIWRGDATPVLALGTQPAAAGRFVVMQHGAHAIAVEVDAVLGVEPLARSALRPLTGTWSQTAAAIGRREDEPLAVMDVARLVPPALAATLARVRAAAEDTGHDDG